MEFPRAAVTVYQHDHARRRGKNQQQHSGLKDGSVRGETREPESETNDEKEKAKEYAGRQRAPDEPAKILFRKTFSHSHNYSVYPEWRQQKKLTTIFCLWLLAYGNHDQPINIFTAIIITSNEKAICIFSDLTL